MKIKDEQMYLTTEELAQVLSAAQQIYNQFSFFTPQLANQNLKTLSDNPLVPTKQLLDKALASEIVDGELLTAYSQFAEKWSLLYNRSINYYANMLAYNLDWTCITPNADFKSKEYKEDVERVCKFLDRFDVKYEFAKATKEVLRSGKWFTWLRTTERQMSKDGVIDINDTTGTLCHQYTLQNMPQKHCMITAGWQNGFMYSFNMNYFMMAGTSIESYDPIFGEYWQKNFVDNKPEVPYNPLMNPNSRDTNFALWQDVSPVNGAWVFTIDPNDANGVPPLAPLIGNVLSDDEMAKLQKNANMLGAKGVLFGDLGLLDKQKSGNTQDALALNPKTITKFLKLARAGLDESLNLAVLPAEGSKFEQFDASKTNNIYANSLKSTAGNAASASRLIYSDDKAGQFELQAQIENDFNFIANRLYPQFERFLNYYVNKKTRNYKFAFSFSGSNYDFMRKQDTDALMKLAEVGFVLSPTSYAKIANMTPQAFLRSLREGKETTSGMLSQLINIYNQSSKTSSANGRPETDIAERSESTNENYE